MARPPTKPSFVKTWLQDTGLLPDQAALDSLTPRAGESNWDHVVRAAGAIGPWAAMNMFPGANQSDSIVRKPIVNFLNAPAVPAPATAGASAPVEPFDLTGFASPGGVTPPSGGGPAGPRADPHVDPAGFFQSVVGRPVQVISGQRDPAHNAKVGGVARSQHIPGDAWDIAVPGMTGTQVAEAIRASGVPYHQLIIEGNSVHYGVPTGTNDGQYMLRHGPAGPHASYTHLNGPLVGPSADPYTAAPIESMDPATAASFIPMPKPIPHVHLPTPPPEALPSAPTPLEGVDPAWLNDLRTASTPTPLDHSHDAWDRMAAMLTGAATAASGAGAAPHVGALLLAAGGGAGRGFKSVKDEQKAAQDHYDDLVRQANVAMAQAGLNVKMQNLETRNQNLQRTDNWTDAKRVTNFNNATRNFQESLNEVMANLGIDQTNIGAMNSTNQARGQAAFGAEQARIAASGQATANQQNLNLQREQNGTSGQTFINGTNALLSSVGIPPTASSDPIVVNAREGAGYMYAGNIDGAISSMATEMVRNGTYDQIDNPTLVANVKRLIGNRPPDILGAASLIGRSMTGSAENHHGAALMAQRLATMPHSPMAQLLARRIKAN